MKVHALRQVALAALLSPVAALAQANVPPGPPIPDGAGLVLPAAEQVAGLPPDAQIAFSVLAWTPAYRIAVLRREHYDDPSQAFPEMHEDKAQIYFILAGSGVQVLGGEPADATDIGNGNHRSDSPLVGGVSHHIKAGDVVVIPALTWHQTLPDEGQPITYQMVDVKTPTRMP